MCLYITAERNRRSEEEAIAEERRRIAREIHDGIAQDLAFIRLRTSKWRRMIESEPERLHGEFDLLRDLLGKNIQEVRRSIFALRPAALDELGFFPAVEPRPYNGRKTSAIQLAISPSFATAFVFPRGARRHLFFSVSRFGFDAKFG